MGSDIPQGNTTYDAARANMGSPWKMPTYNQVRELIQWTVSKWTTLNGVNGAKFTHKTDPTKYIFIPAGGKWYDTLFGQGQYSNYWTTGYSSSNAARQLVFSYDGGYNPIPFIGSISRYVGQPVRAIQ